MLGSEVVCFIRLVCDFLCLVPPVAALHPSVSLTATSLVAAILLCEAGTGRE